MIVTCPSCNYSVTLPPNLECVPSRIKCPTCGVRFAPQAASAQEESLAPAEPEAIDLLEVPIGLDIAPEPGEEPTPAQIDKRDLKVDDPDDEIPVRARTFPVPTAHPLASPEPWFYRFLDGWGVLYLLLALGTFLFAVAVLVYALALGRGPLLPTAIAAVAIICLAGIGLLTCAAVVFLIVDVARNIRQITLNSERNANS